MTRQALGKGLEALLPQSESPGVGLLELDLARIRPNSFQPRLSFDSGRLAELADSIRENGVLQPIVVRRKEDGYEIVAGERRWRAAQQAGLTKIPALIQDVSEQKMLELALVENIQRDELNPIEEAHAYQLLLGQFGLTQEEVARRVARSRTAVTNTLRLLRLCPEVQNALIQGTLSVGHARALIPLPEETQLGILQQILRRGLSVRQTERRVQTLGQPPKDGGDSKDANMRAAEQRLEEHWKTRVEIRGAGNKGHIAFFFNTSDDLDRLYRSLLSSPPS